MDLKNDKSIERLICFVQNLEEKLSSIENIHQKLNNFINIISNTHQNIKNDLNYIKRILNEKKEEEEEEELNNFDSKSLTNLNSKDEQINSPLSINRSSLYSPCSYISSSTNSLNNDNRPNSSISKRSSNLKKSNQISTRIKSVTFNIDQNNQQIQTENIIQNNDLINNLFKQHHQQVTNKQNIGFKLGNSLTNVRIHEIESLNGDYLRLLNISNSDDYDLSEHYLQQNLACVPISRFRFPFNTIIRAGQTITIWCGSLRDIEPQPPHIFLWKEQRRWETGPECVTILAKPSGQAIAWARSSNRVNCDQSSSDILYVHSKCNSGISDITPPNFFKSRSRLSTLNFIGNNKPPFAHSPSNPIHPDHNGILPNDLRSQMHQRSGISQLMNRPKSSPFSSHPGCKQDLISMNYLTNQGHKQTTVKT